MQSTAFNKGGEIGELTNWPKGLLVLNHSSFAICQICQSMFFVYPGSGSELVDQSSTSKHLND